MSDETIVDRTKVTLWGDDVGILAESDSGRIFFVYDEDFLESGLEISPFHLPVNQEQSSTPFSFPELQRSEAFEGLPGVFADALPDNFGHRVLRAYKREHNIDEKLTPIKRLRVIGNNGIGALNFKPEEPIEIGEHRQRNLNFQSLAKDANKIVQGNNDIDIPDIYRIGSSAGGQRPKAIIHYNSSNETLRNGHRSLNDDEIPCILKFDGVGSEATADKLGQPQHYNRVEAAYGDMAKDAGITMPGIIPKEIDGYYHLLIPRFDIRDNKTRRHQHTFGGMRHIDYQIPGEGSYEQYLRTIQELGMNYDSLQEGYRRMIFNIYAVNQDDHVKNVSFHMNKTGEWSLSPAYDVTFAHGEGSTAQHQMTIKNKQSGITRSDCLEVAEDFVLTSPDDIISDVTTVLDNWTEYAQNHDVPDHAINRIQNELNQRRDKLNDDTNEPSFF